MRQVIDFYGIRIFKRGRRYFVRCPFHADGTERTPSLQVYDGYRGFYCRACGTGGDVTKFVHLYENVTEKEAALLLSKRFGVPISDTGDVPPEVVKRANETRIKYALQINREQEINAKLNHLATHIHMLRDIIADSEPFSDIWCYCQNELIRMIGEWEETFRRSGKAR
jgi:DNA primase